MAAQSFRLVMQKGPTPGQVFDLEKEDITIGRDTINHFVINDPGMSRRHARIYLQSGTYIVQDLGSTNGTFVNGDRLEDAHILQPGDLIDLGEQVSLLFDAASYEGKLTVVMRGSQTVKLGPREGERVPPAEEPSSEAEAPASFVIEAAITPQQVQDAYAALASGDINRIRMYWADEMVWQVPGHNQLSGWYDGLNAFLAFMGQVGELSDHSFNMQLIAGQVLVTGDYSVDLTRNRGYRKGRPSKTMDIEVAHVLRWRHGKIIAGKGAIFGAGSEEYDQFWSNSPTVTHSRTSQ